MSLSEQPQAPSRKVFAAFLIFISVGHLNAFKFWATFSKMIIINSELVTRWRILSQRIRKTRKLDNEKKTSN